MNIAAKPKPQIAYVAMGSNLGNRRELLNSAIEQLGKIAHLHIRKVSTFHETPAEGGPIGQPDYLNAVLEIETQLTPSELLKNLQSIEVRLGRERREKNGPRTIDLDLLLFGETIQSDDNLTIPHPRMHLRPFVLDPLVEMAPDLVHPCLGETMKALRDRLRWHRANGVTPTRELTGKRALVTGSTSGIGKAIALTLAAAGADVIVHGNCSREAGLALVKEIEDRGSRGTVLLANLKEASLRDQLAEKAWEMWDGLDILVNNAGIDTLTGEAARWDFDRKLKELLLVDLEATIHLSRYAGERFRRQGHGVILNMGWDQAITGMEGDSGQLFAAVKGGIMAFTRSLAVTLAPEVRVNCLAPGWIQTAWGAQASEIWQARVKRETPLQRWGTPEDVAATARWLCSPAAAYITGQTLYINGGAIR